MKSKTVAFFKNTIRALQDDWLRWMTAGGIGLLLAMLYTWQLDSLVPALNTSEAAIQQQVARDELSLQQAITTDQNFLHYSVALYMLQLFSLESIFALRFVGVGLAILSIVGFFYLISRWHTLRVSVFATVLYASSAVTLHTARVIDESTMYLLVPVLLALAWYAKHTDKTVARYTALTVVASLVLYIPGLFFVAGAVLLWQRKQLLVALKKTNKYPLTVFGGIGVVLVGLLLFSWVLRQNSFLLWAGVSLTDGLPSVMGYGRQLVTTATELFFVGPNDPTRWVGTAGLINPFVTVLFLMGLYSYVMQRQLDRVIVIGIVLAVLLALSGLGGAVDAFVIVPVVYIVAATGIALLLQQWFTVFPKNPIARMFGLFCIVFAVAVTVQYNVQRYFIAWPRTPEVHRAHQIPPAE